ncbi:MAG: Nif3-like dinuclear metal center hexameric protein [Desulfococcaceae bacterium]
MTAPTVSDVMALMETLAPAQLAEEWDNVGLQVGRRDAPVRKIRVALDPLPAVVEAACRDEVDLLVTHHPLIFRPLRQLDFDAPAGRAVEAAARCGMAIFAAHTNLDSVPDGVNDILAERIGLLADGPLMASEDAPGAGIGRVGRLREPGPLDALARRVGRAVGAEFVRVVGNPSAEVAAAALCSGSGGGLLSRFLAGPAGCYITGDLKYHEARDIEAAGRVAVDIGHFASEHLAMAALARTLAARLDERGMAVPVDVAAEEREPFRTLAVNGATIP